MKTTEEIVKDLLAAAGIKHTTPAQLEDAVAAYERNEAAGNGIIIDGNSNEHDGGECPVNMNDVVQVTMRDGTLWEGLASGAWWVARDEGDPDHLRDVVAYRVVRAADEAEAL